MLGRLIVSALKWRLSGSGSTVQCEDNGLRSQSDEFEAYQPCDFGTVDHPLHASFSLLIRMEQSQYLSDGFKDWHIVGPQQMASGNQGNI